MTTVSAAQPSPEQPWLVGDIGGTNARFALITEPAGGPVNVHVLRCTAHRDLVGLVQEYRERVGGPDPRLGSVALAGPITGDRCRTTNAQIEFSISATAGALGLDRLNVLNDFAAAALAAVSLQDEHATLIGFPKPVADLPIAVVGPGTGLGVAALVPMPGSQPVVLPGEGGHMLLPALDDIEMEIVRAARDGGVILTAEMIVSGPGLRRLHDLVARVHGVSRPLRTPEEICSRAVAGSDHLCEESLQIFCTLLGAVASNVALTTGARGGIYLAGGILPQFATFLARSGFRSRFETNPVMAPYLKQIATVLMTDPYPGLRGAAAALAAIVA